MNFFKLFSLFEAFIIEMDEPSVAKNVEMRVQLMLPDIHTKEFQCPVCAKYFSRKFTLDAHMLIHKGEKPHACPFCGKCFRQKGTLMRHKALHSTKNLFHCSLCNRGFRQKNVFIHHLRHRHNVSVETLDRRKYRPELKDYQSIMDTLPSFVHADSTAIASSEKHFDTVLFESIKKPGYDSIKLFGEYRFRGNGLQLTQADNSDFSHIKSKDSCDNEYDNLYLDGNSNESNFAQNYKSTFMSQACSVGTKKSVVRGDFTERDSTISSVNFPNRNSSKCSIDTKNSACSEPNDVTSLNNFDDENLLCSTCMHSFTDKVEYKLHIKTHIPNVLLEDVNSENYKTNTVVSDSEVNQLGNGLTASTELLKPLSSVNSRILNEYGDVSPFNIPIEISSPVKLEAFDSKVDMPSSSNERQNELSIATMSENNSSDSKLKCPLCEVILSDENDFKNHSKKHDSFSTLKFMYELLKNSHVDKNKVSNYNVKNSTNSYLTEQNQKILKVTALKVNSQLKEAVTHKKKSSKKSVFKTIHCSQCYKKFSNKFLLEYHRQLHLSPKGFFCECCHKRFKSKKLLLSHTRAYHMKVFTCLTCSRAFNYQKLYKSHQKSCRVSAEFKTSNGSSIDFPIMNIESLLNSDMNGLIGIIPVCNTSLSRDLKVGIPVMSIPQIKTLYTQCKHV